MEKEYKIVDGTYYHKDTPDKLIEILEHSRYSLARYTFTFGYGWRQTGHVGRTTGEIKSPLIILKRSSSGGILLDEQLITKVEHANKRNGTKPLFDITEE